MSWCDNGHLRDISDAFWTFIGHKVFAGDGFAEMQTAQKRAKGVKRDKTMWTESKLPESHADRQDLPEGYRMTELGPLPEEWRVVRLGDVVSYQKRTLDPQTFPEELFVL